MILKSINDIKIKIVLLLFFLHNVYYATLGGATYDELGYRFGSKIIINTFIDILRLDFTSAKSYYSDLEYYGQLVLMPSYLFSHFMSTYILTGLDFSVFKFYSYDDKFYFMSHFFLTIYTIAMLLLIYKLIKSQRNEQIAFWFITFLLLIPSFIGHSLFNLKDIPFALNFFIVILCIDKNYIVLKSNSYLDRKQIIISGIALGALLTIRINAIPFIGIFILFYLREIKKMKKIKDYLISNLKIGCIGIFFLILLTPSMWIEPISWWKLAIENQFLLPWPGSTLVNGNFITATEMTSSYLLSFFFYKMPINFILFTCLFIISLLYKKDVNIFSKNCLYFVVVVNILFIVFRPTAYDGLRQYIFLLLPITYLVTETIFYSKNKRNFFISLLALNLCYLLFTQASLGQYKYVYFNEFVDENSITIDCNNIDGCGDWSSDYWGYSGKQLANFINENINNGFLLVCRPDVSIKTYLDNETTNFIYNSLSDSLSTKKLNYTTTDTTILRDFKLKSFYIATFHRPRLNENSCSLDPKVYCETVYVEKTKLRDTAVNLSSIKKCNM